MRIALLAVHLMRFEADKTLQYLSAEGTATSEGSKRLTDRLLSFTRQQRHLAMRVIISTYVAFYMYRSISKNRLKIARYAAKNLQSSLPGRFSLYSI
jgi:hypothetical protein